MAEEKKKILIHTADGDHVVAVGEHKPKQTFGAMPVKDYVAAVADPDGLPQAGSVGAVVSALAAAMGSLAVRALRSDDASLQKTAEELRQMTDYMVFQIDEELRAREPLDRRRAEENITRTDLDSALRVASDIPNEIVYIMCRRIEQHHRQQVGTGLLHEDRTAEALPDQPRDAADVVDVSMADHQRIERGRIERERLEVARLGLAPALDHPAVEQHPPAGRLDQMHRAGDLARRAVELHAHVRILRQTADSARNPGNPGTPARRAA